MRHHSVTFAVAASEILPTFAQAKKKLLPGYAPDSQS
jgi:hypothetical protein